jgi:hypothetical protein
MANARLIVQRKSEADLKMRDLLVRIDDLPEFNLSFGQSRELEISGGEHILVATNRLYSEKTAFEIGETEDAIFEVANVPSGCLAAVFIGLGMGLYKVKIQRLS